MVSQNCLQLIFEDNVESDHCHFHFMKEREATKKNRRKRNKKEEKIKTNKKI